MPEFDPDRDNVTAAEHESLLAAFAERGSFIDVDGNMRCDLCGQRQDDHTDAVHQLAVIGDQAKVIADRTLYEQREQAARDNEATGLDESKLTYPMIIDGGF